MASIYTDEARLARYSVLSRKKEQYERIFSMCLGIYALLAVAELAGGVFSPMIAVGLHVNSITRLQGYPLLINLIVFLIGLCGILFREWRLSLPAAACVLLTTIMGGYTAFYIGSITLLPLAAAVWVGLKWSRLKKEEGFPRFRIDFEEYEARQKAQRSYIQNRALTAGVRTKQQPLDPNAEMTDLADGAVTEALPAALQNYHNRGVGSDPVVQAPEPAFHTFREIPGQPAAQVPHAASYERSATLSPEDVGGLDEL